MKKDTRKVRSTIVNKCLNSRRCCLRIVSWRRTDDEQVISRKGWKASRIIDFLEMISTTRLELHENLPLLELHPFLVLRPTLHLHVRRRLALRDFLEFALVLLPALPLPLARLAPLPLCRLVVLAHGLPTADSEPPSTGCGACQGDLECGGRGVREGSVLERQVGWTGRTCLDRVGERSCVGAEKSSTSRSAGEKDCQEELGQRTLGKG